MWCCRKTRGGKPLGVLTDQDLERYMKLAISEYLAAKHGPEARDSEAKAVLRIFLDMLPYDLDRHDLRRAYVAARDAVAMYGHFEPR